MIPFTGLVGRWSATPARARWIVMLSLAVPLAVSVVTLRATGWRPVLDLAMTEFRVRDVGGRHTPLIGLPGRIGEFPDQGSHPGPLSFYLLAPTYRLLGASAWSLQVGAVLIVAAAVAVATWLAARRGGAGVVVAVGVLTAVLVRGYGLDVIAQPWNPYLPLMCWFVVVLAVWGVLAGDHRCLVVAVAFGSLCAQTHLPYLGLALGMGALCAVSLVVDAARSPMRRNEMRSSVITAVVVGVVVWTPVLVDQVTSSPGNVSMLVDHFGTPPEDPVGQVEGFALLVRHLDVTRLAAGGLGADGFITRAGFDLTGSVVPGGIVAAVWLATAAVAVRLRDRRLVALHAVVGWWSLLAAFSMGRIFGKVWFYLTLWAWMLGLVMVAAVVATVWTWVAMRRPARADAFRTAAVSVVAVIGAVTLGLLVRDSFGVRAPEQHLSDTLDMLIAPTADAIDDGVGAATGRDGRYWVTWSDARYFGSQGYGLLNELERRGYDVFTPWTWRVPVTAQRTSPPDRIDAEIRLATGVRIAEVAAIPGAELVVEFDPRDADDLAEYAELETEVRGELEVAGLGELVGLIETNLFGLQVDPRVSVDVQRRVDRMLELGAPTAVYVLPTGTG